MVYRSMWDLTRQVGTEIRTSLSVRPDYETVSVVDFVAKVAGKIGRIVWSDPVSAVLAWIDCEDEPFYPDGLSGLDLDLWEIDQAALYATSLVADEFGLSEIPVGGEVTVGTLRSAWDSSRAAVRSWGR